MARTSRFHWILAACAVVTICPAVARAQQSPAAEAEDPKMAEAKERFTRGLRLYADANYEAARVEFERAYALAPSWKLLYNVGYCYRQLNDYVSAIRALDRFIAEGASEIAEARREEVKKVLDDLRTRIGSVAVTTSTAGATISVDDVPVGTSPLSEPVLVNPGRRKITASQRGGGQATQVVTVAGMEKAQVNLEIEGPRTIVVEKPRQTTNLTPYIAWGVTGAFAIGSVVTGVLALNAQSDQEAQLTKLGATPAEQRDAAASARDKTQTLSVVTDVLLIGTVASAGVATFFTIKAMRSSGETKKDAPSSAAFPRLRAQVAGSGVLLSGWF